MYRQPHKCMETLLPLFHRINCCSKNDSTWNGVGEEKHRTSLRGHVLVVDQLLNDLSKNAGNLSRIILRKHVCGSPSVASY